MKNKSLLYIILLICCFSISVVTVEGADIIIEGTPKPSLIPTANVTATPSLYASSFEIDSNGVLIQYNGDSEYVVIPDGVTAIGSSAFRDNNTLKNIVIPDSVISIGESAFEACYNLESVSISNGLLSIGEKAFLECRRLHTITLPKTLNSIGIDAFGVSSSLKSIELPEGLSIIGRGAFYSSGITDVTIPDSVTSIGSSAFDTTVTVNASRESYASGWAIADKRKLHFIGDGDFTIVGNTLYSYVGSDTDIIISSDIETIAGAAFAGSQSLKSVEIPSSVTAIDNDAFRNCQNLENVTLHEGLLSIAPWVFVNCNKLESIFIPSSVISIGNNAIEPYTSIYAYTGSYAAQWAIANNRTLNYLDEETPTPTPTNTCGTNVKYSIDGNTINFTKVDSGSDAFWGDCGSVFKNNSAITVVNVNDTIKAPEDCSNLFDDYGYVQRMNLAKLDVSSVTDMSDMFYNCSSLTRLDMSGWNTSNVKNMKLMFCYCTSLSSLDLSGWDTSNVESMAAMFGECSALLSLDMSGWDTSNVTNMSDMFYNCSSLRSLDLSDWDTSNVTFMMLMFYGCSSLENLEMRGWNTSNVTNIVNMFGECSALTSLDVSGWDTSNMTSLLYAFNGCSSLKTITLGNNSLNNNIYTSLPAYNDTWYYLSIGEAYAPLPAGSSLNGSVLFEEYDPYMMAGTWTTDQMLIPTMTPTPTPINTCGTNVKYSIDGNTINFTKVDSGSDAFWGDCGSVFKNNSAITVVNVNDTIKAPEDCSNLFDEYSYVQRMNLAKLDVSNVVNMTYMFHKCSSLVSLDVSTWDTSNVMNMSFMFWYCSSLENLDVSGWDTSNVLSMYYMFSVCSSLTSLDVSKWDTSNVGSMSYMFNYCYSLKSLDVSGWDTSNVGSMNLMFYNCSSLTSLDVSGWNTSNVYDMGYMFSNCSSMTSLDVSGWDTSNVLNMGRMFSNCSALKSLDVSGWNTSNVGNSNISYGMDGMFYNCSALKSLDVSGWDTSNVKLMDMVFTNCSSLHTITLGKKSVNKNIFTTLPSYNSTWYYLSIGEAIDPLPIGSSMNGSGLFVAYNADWMAGTWTTDQMLIPTMTPTPTPIYTCGTNVKYTIDGNAINFSKVDSGADAYWGDCGSVFKDNSAITVVNVNDAIKAPVDSSFLFYGYSNVREMNLSKLDVTNVTNMVGMFRECSSLMSLDVSGWNTSNVTAMSRMFYECSSLMNLNVSSWDTSNVYYMSAMFEYCSSLTDLDVGNWNTTNVTNMSAMFYGCSLLENLDVSSWDTSNVTNMYGMFYECSSLTNLDVGKWNTAKVTNLGNMFRNCSSLADLDVSNWNTANVTNLGSMFLGCSLLENLNLSAWNTSNVTNMSGMFCMCFSLTNLNISSWDTSNVNHMGSMFEQCSSLTNLDVGNWNTANVTVMGSMFDRCFSLTHLDVSNWNTAKVTNMNYMFRNCYSLTSLDLSKWDTSNLTMMSGVFYACDSLTTFSLGVNTGKSNIFSSLPGYNDTWHYISVGEAIDPMPIGASLTGSVLFGEYNADRMAGTWKIGKGFIPNVDVFSLFIINDDGIYQNVTKQTIEMDAVTNETLALRTLTPDGSSPAVEWKSSSAAVASVDNGVVTALRSGNATITASYKQGTKTVSALVKVKVVQKVQPQSILIIGPDEIAVGKTGTYKVTFEQELQPTNKAIVWSSTDTKTAAVNTSGVVTGKKLGDAEIVACAKESAYTAADGKTAYGICSSHPIRIAAVTESIQIIDAEGKDYLIDLYDQQVGIGVGYQLASEALPAEASQTVTWKSSAPAVASVDETGLVTGLKAGTVTITAKATDGSNKSASVKITVGVMPQEGSLTVSGGDQVAQKKTLKLTAAFNQTPLPTKSKVTWESSDTSIAKVDSSGTVTGVSGGKTIIRVSSAADPRIYVDHEVEVVPLAAGVEIIDAEDDGLVIDLAGDKDTYQLGALVEPAEAVQTVTWTSGSKTTATVDESGLVTGLKAGTVTITAKTTDGSNKSASVKINIGVMPQPGSLMVSGGDQVAQKKTLKLTAAFNQTPLPTNSKVTWESSDPTIAKVDSSGTVTGVSGGKTIIRVSSAADPRICVDHEVEVVPLAVSVEVIDTEDGGLVIDLAGDKDTYQLGALVEPAEAVQTVTWTSGSKTTATVDETGLVTGLKAGTVTITAKTTDGSNKSASVKINIGVMPQPGSLMVSGGDQVAQKKTLKLTASFNQLPQPTSTKVTFESADLTIAKVDASGTVTGVSGGKTSIRVSSAADPRIYVDHEVEVVPLVNKITMLDTEDAGLVIDLAGGKNTYQLGTLVEPAEAIQSVTWISSAKTTADVDENGLVTGLKAGTVTITAKAADGSGKSGTIKLTVTAKVQPGSLRIEGANAVGINKTITLKAVFDQPVQPTNAKVKWESSNPVIATVSSTGVVKGLRNGTVTIRVSSVENPAIYDDTEIMIGTGVFSSAAGLDEEGNPAEMPAGPQAIEAETEVKNEAELGFAGEEVYVKVGDSLILEVVNPEEQAVIVGLGGDTDAVQWDGEQMKLTSLEEEAELTAYLSTIDPVEVRDTLTIHVVRELPDLTGSDEGEAAADNEDPEMTGEPAAEENAAEETAAPEDQEAAGSEAEEQPADVLGFAEEEIYLKVGDSLILEVVNPEAEAVIVGLSGDTDAVLWNSELRMVTPIGEAELVAYLSTVDPIEVRDMVAIHVVRELPESAAETEMEAAEVTGDDEVSDETGDAEASAEGIEPTEVPTEAPTEAAAEGTDDTSSDVSDETAAAPEGESAEDETAAAGEPETLGAEQAPAKEEFPAVVIRDLEEYEDLNAFAGILLNIDRDRFELSDEQLTGLVFEIENEAIARLTDRSPEEMLLSGVEIQPLQPGETRLLIRQEGKDEALREIRLVVSILPAATEEPEAEADRESEAAAETDAPAPELTAEVIPTAEPTAVPEEAVSDVSGESGDAGTDQASEEITEETSDGTEAEESAAEETAAGSEETVTE